MSWCRQVLYHNINMTKWGNEMDLLTLYHEKSLCLTNKFEMYNQKFKEFRLKKQQLEKQYIRLHVTCSLY